MLTYFFKLHSRRQSFYDPHRLFSTADFIIDPDEICLLVVSNTNDFVGRICSCEDEENNNDDDQLCILISNDSASPIHVGKNAPLVKLLQLCTSQICRVSMSDIVKLSVANKKRFDEIIQID